MRGKKAKALRKVLKDKGITDKGYYRKMKKLI